MTEVCEGRVWGGGGSGNVELELLEGVVGG